MGHRALVAYRDTDGTYRLHFSGWGADPELAGRITPATPFGGANDMAPGYVGALTAALTGSVDDDADVQVARHMTDADDTPVEPDPIEIGVDFDGVLAELDEAAYEMLFVVEPVVDGAEEPVDMHVRAYRVQHDLAREKILIEPPKSLGEGYRSDSYQDGWYRGVRDQCKALVDDGVLDEEEANQRLHDAVLERYAEHHLSEVVLARSPAITAEERNEYPCAFLRMGGRSRVLGEMWPTRIHDPDAWELPDGFPAVKTAKGERVEVV